MSEVFYDIETDPQRLTVAVTWDDVNQFKIWYEANVLELITFLLSFDSIIGFNIIK